MAVFGIDISAHNAGLNLQAAKNEGVRFAKQKIHNLKIFIHNVKT